MKTTLSGPTTTKTAMGLTTASRAIPATQRDFFGAVARARSQMKAACQPGMRLLQPVFLHPSLQPSLLTRRERLPPRSAPLKCSPAFQPVKIVRRNLIQPRTSLVIASGIGVRRKSTAIRISGMSTMKTFTREQLSWRMIPRMRMGICGLAVRRWGVQRDVGRRSISIWTIRGRKSDINSTSVSEPNHSILQSPLISRTLCSSGKHAYLLISKIELCNANDTLKSRPSSQTSVRNN